MIANRKNIKLAASSLFGNEGATEQKTKELIELCDINNISGSLLQHRMEKIDKLLHNYGVESLYPELDLEYSNTGYTYAITIYYFRDRFHIGSWGDVVEKHGSKNNG